MRRPRLDGVDTWHHVMNRGVGQRTLFENACDMRKFLACVAREVRRGTIAVHAFCLMTNHFHLLLHSVNGELSAAMRRVQNSYSRWFNRTRGRRGPLYESRFRSYIIDSLAYRRQVVSYIHDNPIEAGMVASPDAYMWSSASHYGATKRPRWLATDWVEGEMLRRGGEASCASARLLEAFPVRVNPDFREHIERQFSSRVSKARAEEDATPHFVMDQKTVEWFMDRTALGDGTRPFCPPCRADAAEKTIAESEPSLRRVIRRAKKSARTSWLLMRVALLRLSGLTLRAIGYRVGRDESTVCRDLQHHRRRVKQSPRYRALAANLVATALARTRAA